MPDIDLFPRDQIAGIFRGFTEGGLEFHADLVLPYRNDFQSIPMHGQFLLVQLETPNEAVLGRITSLASDGKLAFGAGEEFNIRAVRDNRSIPEDLREQYLKYRVNIRVLGVMRNDPRQGLVFAPSHRRLPHLGSQVAFPSGEVLRHIAGHYAEGAAIGNLAMGEYIYSGASDRVSTEKWMQVKAPEISINFPIHSLVSRRSFIFARAGFGKSNLTKLLFSKLYEDTPTVTKRGGRQVPVGTVIFDPDGEYFWPDDKGRPGLCDVPALREKLVIFTSRPAPSPFYGSFVTGGIKLDIRRLTPADVISIALPPEKQEQQNVAKLRSMNRQDWRKLVDLVQIEGNNASTEDIARLLNLDPNKQEAEALAAKSNMTRIVRSIHDPNSVLMDALIQALSDGKLCVVDLSQMRGAQSLMLSGLILRRIFDRNQENFTAADGQTIPTIAVVEEAQSVLDEKASSAQPYIEWVKEGRKYDLGALLVTQQPGSIPVEILSQGDNWFIFHLLSAADLINVRRANAHFSDDLLSALLNEPIPGQGVFWSSAAGNPYPVPVRMLSFEKLYAVADPSYQRNAETTYAAQLRAFVHQDVEPSTQLRLDEPVADDAEFVAEPEQGDRLEAAEKLAIDALWRDPKPKEWLASTRGLAWGYALRVIAANLPSWMDNRNELAYGLVRVAMDQIGPQNETWETYRDDKGTTYIRLLKAVDFGN